MVERARNRTAQLVAALNAPTTTAALSPLQWSGLIASARAANLLGLLAERVTVTGVAVPPAAARHLAATRQLSRRQTQSVRWEVHRIEHALAPLDVPIVLLKGAAYAMAEHAVSRGRLFGDIDILVPREAIGDVEVRLMVAGWTTAKTEAYDQHYYRRWMHELPPMVSVRRGTVLDVHHTILPLTSRHSPDPSRIVAAAGPLPGLPAVRIPRVEHLLIHSIVHLLHDGELHHGLRDLFDIDGLIRASGESAGFWEALADAACELDVAAPVQFGLHLARQVIGTPIPTKTFDALAQRAALPPPSAALAFLYRRAVAPKTAGESAALSGLAEAALYVRAHWLRMPPHLLIRHLAHKSLMRLKKNEPAVGRA